MKFYKFTVTISHKIVQFFLLFVVPQPNGQTRFNLTYYQGSTTCTAGTGIITLNQYTGMNTTTCKKVVGAIGSNNVPTGATSYSISFGTTVGFTSGVGIVQYATTPGCVAATFATASQLVVQSASSVCSQAARGSIMYSSPVFAACPAVVATPTIIYASTR